MPPQVTIDEVARRCGLSVATVSNALSGQGRMRAETRERVRTTAGDMGYVASAAARGLRLSRSYSVGLLVPDLANPMYGEVARGAADVLEPAGYQLLTASHDAQSARQVQYVANFIRQRVAGAILQPWSSEDPEVMDLVAADIPVVLLARRHYTQPTDCVGIDNGGSMRRALEHLADLGHSRIAISIGGGRRSSSADERLAAYLAFMKSRFGHVDESLVMRVPRTDLECGAAMAPDVVKLGATAAVASNDLVAIGLRGAMLALGKRVPEDFSLVAIDDTYLAALPGIEITSMSLSKRKIGEIAAQQVLERVRQPSRAHEDIVLEAELTVRRSTTWRGQ